MGVHDPGCPTSRALFARDVGKFPADHPIPQQRVKPGVIPKARAFTSAPRDLPLNSSMGGHDPGCPTSRALFARDVGKFPADHPTPQETGETRRHPEVPAFSPAGRGISVSSNCGWARPPVPHFSRAFCARRGEVSRRPSDPAGKGKRGPTVFWGQDRQSGIAMTQ